MRWLFCARFGHGCRVAPAPGGTAFVRLVDKKSRIVHRHDGDSVLGYSRWVSRRRAQHWLDTGSGDDPLPRHALRKPSFARTIGAGTDGTPVPRYRSIRFKLLFSFVAVILLPILTLGIFGPLFAARAIESEAIGHTARLIRQVTNNIEFYIREMEAVISILAEDPDVQAFYASQVGPLGWRRTTSRGRGGSCARSRPSTRRSRGSSS